MHTLRAFTLIELLVVISIVGILSSLSIVSVSSARAKAVMASVRTSMSASHQAVTAFRTETSAVIVPGVPAGGNTIEMFRFSDNTTLWHSFIAPTFGDDNTHVSDPAAMWNGIFSGTEKISGSYSYALRLGSIPKLFGPGGSGEVAMEYSVRSVSVGFNDPMPVTTSTSAALTTDIDPAKLSGDYRFIYVAMLFRGFENAGATYDCDWGLTSDGSPPPTSGPPHPATYPLAASDPTCREV